MSAPDRSIPKPARKSRGDPPGQAPAGSRLPGAAPPFRLDWWDRALIATMLVTGLPIMVGVLAAAARELL